MNDSETRRSPHKNTASHRKNKYLFRNLPFLWCCSRWINRQEGNRKKASRNPSGKNYDFTMFWSHITAFHGIAVKWYLRVYWLLPLSIVASFKKNRRFFCLAPTILLLRIDASFGKHRRLFWKAPWILGPVNQLHFPKESFPYFNGLFFSSSTEIVDSLLKQQTPATRSSCLFVWQNGHAKDTEPKFFGGPCQDMCLRYWRTGINET